MFNNNNSQNNYIEDNSRVRDNENIGISTIDLYFHVVIII